MPRIRIGAFATIAMVSIAAAGAPDGGQFLVRKSVIAGGGAPLGGGPFRLIGTIGQPAAASLAASRYRVYDGFWAPAPASGDRIFANGFDP